MEKLTPEQIRAERVKQRNITIALMVAATIIGCAAAYVFVWPNT